MVYSLYKSRYIVKVVICVVLNGVIIYCFFLYLGLILDVVIVCYSKVFEKFKFGDLILIDKGFIIYD